MATVNKNFRIKDGLIVEGTTGTINGEDILTKAQADIDYIIGEVGGSGSSTNTPDTLVLRDGNGNFAAGQITANEIVVQTAGNIFEDSGLNITSTTGNGIGIQSAVGVNITASSGNVDIYADTGAYVNEDEIATLTASQTLTNKTVDDVIITGTASFRDGSNTEYLTIDESFTGTARLIAADDLSLRAANDIVLYPGNDDGGTGKAYVHWGNDATGAGAGNEIATIGATQIFTNKTINDELFFTNPSTTPNDGGIKINDSTEDFEITAYTADVVITSYNGDIVLNADGTSYLTSATSGNEIATHSYVGSQGFLTSADLSGYATESYVGTAVGDAIDNLVDGAPGLLDTLNELAAAINDDANYATTMTTALATKVNAVNPEFTIGSGPGTSLYTATGVDYISNYGSSMPNWYYIRPDATGMSGITALNLQQDNFSIIISGTGTQYDGTWKGYKAEDWAIRFYGPLGIASGYTFNSSFTFEIKEGIPAKTISSAELSLLDGLTSPLVTTVELATKQNTLTAGNGIGISGSTISVAFDAGAGLAINGTNLTVDDNVIATKSYVDDNFVTLDGLPGQLDNYILGSEKGQALGVATLDEDGYVPVGQLGNAAASLDGESITPNSVVTNVLSANGLGLQTYQVIDGTPTVVLAVQNVAKAITVDTASQATAFYWCIDNTSAPSQAAFKTAELIVKTSNGTHTEVSKLLVTADSSNNLAVVEYGNIGTNGTLGTIEVIASDGGSAGYLANIKVTTEYDNSEVTVYATLLA